MFFLTKPKYGCAPVLFPSTCPMGRRPPRCVIIGRMKKGFVGNIERETLENADYRKVLYTGAHLQLVLMTIASGEEIGLETHHLDQFIRIEEGEARITIGDETHALSADQAVVIPEGTPHNVVNTGTGPLKLYSLYGPPEHKDGTRHPKRSDEREEHWDGKTTE